MISQLVFATGNRAKLAQLAFVIAHLNAPVRLISAREQYGDQAAYEEIGTTAALVALNGAQAVAERIGLSVAVEDSTFHVAALNDAPGIRSAEYLRSYGRKGILEELGENSNRRARIVSAVAWATPDGDSQVWVNIVEGRIAHREWVIKGMPEWVGPSRDHPYGGGYNAIFIPQGDTRAISEIPPEEAIYTSYREPNFCGLIAFVQARNTR